MAKQNAPRVTRKTKQTDQLALESINYYILLTGVAVILIGYTALSMGPWDGFFPLTVAPILLVLGYCVIIPAGIIYRKPTVVLQQGVAEQQDTAQTA